MRQLQFNSLKELGDRSGRGVNHSNYGSISACYFVGELGSAMTCVMMGRGWGAGRMGSFPRSGRAVCKSKVLALKNM